jgi:hypothetical protein
VSFAITLLCSGDNNKVNSSFITYRTSQYKLHYYETPTNIKFVMLTDTKSPNMRVALQQIYINLYVEYGRSDAWLPIADCRC